MTTHADPHALPTLPFTNAEHDANRVDDVQAAKYIGTLTTGIFGMGFVLYVIVLLSSGVQQLLYNTVR